MLRMVLNVLSILIFIENWKSFLTYTITPSDLFIVLSFKCKKYPFKSINPFMCKLNFYYIEMSFSSSESWVLEFSSSLDQADAS